MIPMVPREAPQRTMIAVKPETRDLLNRCVVQICSVFGYKISQDTALSLILQSVEEDMRREGIAEALKLV